MKEDKESDEVKEVSEDDEGELLKHLVIKKDEDITIDAIPLATKLPVIINYKLHKEDREDLEVLWRIVKTKFSDTRPEDEFERVLWGDLKVMFEPDSTSDVWRMLQGYRVTIWKLIDSSGVHFSKVTTVSIKISIAGTYYCLCSVSAAGYKDTTVVDLQLLEDLLLSRG
ncbi:hypothetical protein Tco_0479394 [Tanacetum coccineum]